ncbi:putative Fe2+/Mn2+ transporter, VIT1/CCC1 family [Metschnikowia aff. pulcherrima]|uniref:Putative Fe2+/Mn2+ transporter, VIT1/CCC1 family n=1 Tax=Metschnikowia aff. pulcherrima TaxID=2163413 RepID=A0A4P6XDK7_9ASCO|nr:putative Fe2+/Mn2+ transporter, VIT1/CCC1 family [Metschnikowia aff. pulcherrima]
MLVQVKNVVALLLSKKDKSDDDLRRAERLLDENRLPYGSTDGDDRAQAAAAEEAIVSAAKHINSDSDDDNEPLGFLNSFDPRVMSDIIIGLSDGLTVPFALTAGLSSLGSSKLVITGGMAELVSGAISMGLGGYLAAKSELDYYHSEVKKEKLQFFKKPETLNQEAAEIMFELGASEQTIASFLKDMGQTPKNLIDFVIRFGKGLEEPAEGREFTSALTIGSGYFLGGFVPLVPYFFCNVVRTGLIISVVVMIVTLFIFGYVKTLVSLGDDCGTKKKVLEGLQMVAIGSVAAGAAWTLVYFIE